MPTEKGQKMRADCSSNQLSFQAFSGKSVGTCLDGGHISSDAGGLLLREIECGQQFLRRFSQCFLDLRDKRFVQHSVEELLAQRIYGLCFGHEDLNDQLRADPLLALLCSKSDLEGASRRGQVMGLRMVEIEEEFDRTPWRRPPSRYAERPSMIETLPSKVRAVISQRLFLERNGLPSPLLNQIRRVAAFQNPEFYKRQSMRLSTALTPRVIACAEELSEHIALPRGCWPEAEALLAGYGVAHSVEDKREEGAALECSFTGTLTSSQERAAKALLAHDMGVLVAPPGTGKTVIGTFLIAMRRRNTLVLVHRKPLLDQWVAQLSLFLGKEPKEIGQIGSGKDRPTGEIDVAMMQSLIRRGRVADLVASYGHVIVDECHHVPAVSFERVLSEVKAKFVTGLTATPRRRDGQQPILHMQLGPVRFFVDSRNKSAQRAPH